MNSHGLLHFDTHFDNIPTDGHRLYVGALGLALSAWRSWAGALGLALSARFDLSPAEQQFAAQNLSHDAGYTMTQLVNWLVTTSCSGRASGTGRSGKRAGDMLG